MADIQVVVDLARETINDDDKVRWTDAEMLKYAQDGLDTLFKMRPDMFYGTLATFDSETLSLTSTFPINDRYRRMAADYIIMRCETKNEESVVSGRAGLTYKFFSNEAYGIVAT